MRYQFLNTGLQSVLFFRWNSGLVLAALAALLTVYTPTMLAREIKLAPPTIPGSTKVDAEKLIELVGSIPDLKLIDSRIRMDRKQGYIEGSVSLPDEETNCMSLAKNITTKKSPVLFYCNGVKCGRSVTAVRIALKCGYDNIYWFRGGFLEWKEKGYPALKQ